jgi:hypothetical protein
MTGLGGVFHSIADTREIKSSNPPGINMWSERNRTALT